VGANPTATAGPTAVNGSATTFMRSDAAPAVQLGSSSQKGIVQVDGTTITAAAGVISSTGPTISGTPVTGNCVKWASATALGDQGAACGSGGGRRHDEQLLRRRADADPDADALFVGGERYIQFSIPQGYQDLELVSTGRGDTAAEQADLQLQFNGDTGSNYDWQRVFWKFR
jgi:hypothetical protein